MKNVINMTELKTRLPLVQAMIKARLKIDAGAQSTYDIMAASNGFKDHHTVKGMAQKDFYALRTNISNEYHPRYITVDLGYFDSQEDAERAIDPKLSNNEKFLDFELTKNGEPTDCTFNTGYMPSRGMKVHVELTAETYDELEEILDDMKYYLIQEQTKESELSRDSSSFSYIVRGEEYDPASSVDCLIPDNQFAIFDAKGVIDSCDDLEEINAIWYDKDNHYEEWDTFLIYAQLVSLQEALANDNEMYHAICRDNGTIYSGDIEGIVDSLKDEKNFFSLFQEISRV